MTTFAGLIQDEHAINQWRMRAMLEGLVRRPDLMQLARSLTDPVDEQKKQANDINAEAVAAGKITKKANIGTAYHQFTETIDEGGTPRLEDHEVADMAAYRATLARSGFEVVEIETICVNFTYGYAGTLDRLLRHKKTGAYYIGDLKTGAQPHRYPHEICLQLAGYNHAEYFYRYLGGDPTNLDNWQCVPVPKMAKNKAVVIHLVPGSGECNLYYFNTQAGWEMFDALKAVRTFRAKKDLVKPIELPTAAGVIVDAFPGAELVITETPVVTPMGNVMDGAWNQTIHEGAPELPTDVAFEPTPPIPAATAVIETTATEADTIVEGELVRDALKQVRDILAAYNWPKGGKQERLLGQWLTEGGRAKKPWRMSSKTDQTERRFILYRAAIDLLEWFDSNDVDEDVCAAVVCYALNLEYQYGPTFKLGATIGALGRNGAELFHRCVGQLHDTSDALAITFNVKTGKPEVTV